MPPPFTHFTAAQRRTVREMAMLNIAAPLLDDGGPLILPLTPWHHLMLSGHGNPVFCGGDWGVSEALQYLWLCSPHFFELAGAKWSSHVQFTPASRAWLNVRRRLFFLRWRGFVSRRGAVAAEVRLAITEHVWQFAFDQPRSPKKLDERGKLGKTQPAVVASRFHEITEFEAVCRRCLGYHADTFWHRPYIHTNALLSIVLGSDRDESIPKFDSDRDAVVKEWLRKRRQQKAQSSSN